MVGSSARKAAKAGVESVEAVVNRREADAGLELVGGAMVVDRNARRLRNELCRYFGGYG